MQKLSEEPAVPSDLLSQIEVEPASELRNRKKNEAKENAQQENAATGTAEQSFYYTGISLVLHEKILIL